MPTLLIEQGFRFFFWSNENDEPAHIHVVKDDSEAKIWLEPEIQMAYVLGFTTRQQRIIMEILELNSTIFKYKWNEYFSK